MYIIRPIREGDLDAYEEFSKTSSLGLINLPHNRAILKDKIKSSITAFNTPVLKPYLENYIFVLENRATGELGGTCGIASRMGVSEPHYYYRLDTVINDLTKREMQILTPVCYPIGPTEICALYLKPDFRKEGLGKLLSLCRFLFIASHRERFEEEVVAEMRGYITEESIVPFWEAIGKKFLNISYRKLCEMELESRSFIPSILPRWPLYTALLPPEAQACIGKTHDKTVPALKLLYNQGFTFTGEIDPFDGGPKISCKTDEIKTIQSCKTSIVDKIESVSHQSRQYLISNKMIDFRVCYGDVHFLEYNLVSISSDTAENLNIHIGDPISYVKVPSLKE